MYRAYGPNNPIALHQLGLLVSTCFWCDLEMYLVHVFLRCFLNGLRRKVLDLVCLLPEK